MIMLILMCNFMFLFISHPLTNGCILLMQTILIALLSGMLNLNFWYSYMIFLIMIGGLLILFIYMTSIASNEKFKFNNMISIFMLLTIFSIVIIYLMNFLYFDIAQIQDTQNFFLQKFIQTSMIKYLNYPNNMIFMMMIIYLFITLIAVMKIIQFSYGPLRQKF
uniref:NADH-ubiquinone oxidoreductase chain 6 n=2 Tax=Altica TaxID=131581 RepID=A0A4P8JB08_9CUCU|nr:NADH dehydrogenase subunit 6 [Altica cirsicola]QCC71387.1 NADH dehydrogenase subunit 6 [Altica viridicyanea]QCC71374.1 NADH dehydrogenase subunit 6 [Altica cirsicola]QCP68683.1 NADH dehydrogenase subunit 6 [Altica viridicyanea]QCP68696.1 NADH dehydrogenase subunit 6 [Altica viridicyanea]QCP68722.1 NADH dehydrogenase subunit 6 [Altica cirsicola]